jgi:hypothetical protein
LHPTLTSRSAPSVLVVAASLAVSSRARQILLEFIYA